MDEGAIAGAIILGAGSLAGAIRWGAGVVANKLAPAVMHHATEVAQVREALKDNTRAVREATKSTLKAAGLFVLLLLLLPACATMPAEYVAADEATRAAVWPDYARYFEADPELSDDDKQSKRDVGLTWQARINAAKGD